MKKVLSLILVLTLAAAIFTGCTTGSGTEESSNPTTDTSMSGTVTAAGSSALAPLAQKAAEEFKNVYPNISVSVSAGGSGTGLTQVSQQTIDIGNSDVEASEKLDAEQSANLVDHKVCVIGVAAVVNSDVTVTNLTTEQLIGIFTGTITNWKDVGGEDEQITVVGRPSSSGTRALFTKYALNDNEEMTSSLQSDDSGTLLANIGSTKGAIGYLALSYLTSATGVKSVSIDGVAPTLDNIYSGSYKVWGEEHMYTYGEATGAVKAFLDFIVSDDFAPNIESMGYGVYSKMTVTTH